MILTFQLYLDRFKMIETYMYVVLFRSKSYYLQTHIHTQPLQVLYLDQRTDNSVLIAQLDVALD